MTPDARTRPALARVGPLPAPDGAELAAEALRRFPPGSPVALPCRQPATDPTGTVRITVDARGRVTEVAISTRWRDRLDAEGLVAALRDTYRAAVRQAGHRFALASLAAHQAGQDPPPPGLGAAARRSGRPPDPAVDRPAWSRWLQDRRGSIRTSRERRSAIEAATRQGPREHTGRHGYLTATVDGLEITRITGDARSIWHASTERLQQDALELLSIPHQPLRH